ncbi:CcmD family protein [Chloroflexota bacterium]
MENLGFLFAAYTAIWAVLFGYVLFMQGKQRRLQCEIDLIKKSIGSAKTN